MHTHWALPFARTVIEIWEQEAALNDDENTHSKIICHDKIILQNSALVENLLTFQLDARKMISAKNCLKRSDLWMSSIPLLPFLISGFVEPHNMDTKHSQNASAISPSRQTYK